MGNLKKMLMIKNVCILTESRIKSRCSANGTAMIQGNSLHMAAPSANNREETSTRPAEVPDHYELQVYYQSS